jgi:chromate transport protein ChrA
MTLLLFLEHVIAFIAPAVVVALILTLGLKLRASRPGTTALRVGVLVAGGVIVLLAGLVFFERDGKVATYAALVLVQGSLAWKLRGR